MRARIFRVLAKLNPQQREAVTSINSPLLILAGAGSGKTRVIVSKITWLIAECGHKPRNIAAVTFTNKAAREMKQRVGKLLGRDRSRELNVSTFHTLGLHILRQEHTKLGYKRGFTIFDADDSLGLIREIMKAEGTDMAASIELAQWRISTWKSALVTPDIALQSSQDVAESTAARIYAEYQRHLRAYNAVDFDDLIGLPVELLSCDANARDAWQNRLRYLLVDEYQDTNEAQYRLLKLLAGPRAAFTVVGDDDQSVYSWRGARPENLAQLQQDFPRLKLIKLEQNYRSTRRILRVANQLIGNNPHMFEKRLWSELGEGEKVRVIACRDAEHEGECVIADIMQHKLRHGSSYGDFAILYRGNHQARQFEKLLREHDIPYHLSGGTSFFDRGEVRDIVAYLRLLVNPDDDSAFLRIVNVPRREIGAATLEKLGQYAGGRGISLFSACFEIGLAHQMNEHAVGRLRRFANWVSRTAEHAEGDDPIGVVEEMIDTLGYEQWLKDNGRNPKLAERRMENVRELVQWLARLRKREAQEIQLADMLAHMSLMDRLDRDEDNADTNRVRLMTLHAAKGLEFPHVYLVGVEEELLPHRNSIEGNSLEEERRLAYVGITRARMTLCISHAAQRKRFGETVTPEPSRFLAELPQDDLLFEGIDQQMPPEERQQRGKAHLDNLKNLLVDA